MIRFEMFSMIRYHGVDLAENPVGEHLAQHVELGQEDCPKRLNQQDAIRLSRRAQFFTLDGI